MKFTVSWICMTAILIAMTACSPAPPPLILMVEIDPAGNNKDKPPSELADGVIAILKRRFEKLGIKPVGMSLGDDGRLKVEISPAKDHGVQEIKHLMEIIGELKFMLEADSNVAVRGMPPPPGCAWLPQKEGGPLLVETNAFMSGDMVKSSSANHDDQMSVSSWEIEFNLSAEGREKFKEMTARCIGRKLAIVLDGQVQSAPVIRSPITDGTGRITGRFSKAEAEQLALIMGCGRLPCPVKVSEK